MNMIIINTQPRSYSPKPARGLKLNHDEEHL